MKEGEKIWDSDKATRIALLKLAVNNVAQTQAMLRMMAQMQADVIRTFLIVSGKTKDEVDKAGQIELTTLAQAHQFVHKNQEETVRQLKENIQEILQIDEIDLSELLS